MKSFSPFVQVYEKGSSSATLPLSNTAIFLPFSDDFHPKKGRNHEEADTETEFSTRPSSDTDMELSISIDCLDVIRKLILFSSRIHR
ncbi:uncharacterized protein YALI1_B09931g [Yarrowia lipolytica]|uniref:Uncharacterized protein n=1 Tax=Yarrowia lipolytica TaxID=4952 RepID=A0A1D8N6V5_YARLL|nr:hypothetical protein YALI1_B09931g [Yarrowia lipolytica]